MANAQRPLVFTHVTVIDATGGPAKPNFTVVITGDPYCFPGFSLHDELQVLVQSGLSAMAALQTATRNPARFLGKEADLGTVEKGKLADLVLLDANPLEDMRNTTKIASVVVAGKYFPRTSLQDMLAKAEALANRKSIADALLKTIQDRDVNAAVKQYQELIPYGTFRFAYDNMRRRHSNSRPGPADKVQIPVPTGMLLVGPTGTGKRRIGRLVASRTHRSSFAITSTKKILGR